MTAPLHLNNHPIRLQVWHLEPDINISISQALSFPEIHEETCTNYLQTCTQDKYYSFDVSAMQMERLYWWHCLGRLWDNT